jgi:predicted GTPase
VKPTLVIIMGAAGRDFHNFNVAFRDNPEYQVVAFTAAQIPNIQNRCYPPSLAGSLYPQGIPIVAEDELESLIRSRQVQEGVFAYSDISHVNLMHLASRVLAAGADFRLMGPKASSLRSSKPVISICAVRTGCGKSQTTRKVCGYIRDAGKKGVVVRHPMPYGDLTTQAVQRFATLGDMDTHRCTLEEREEYEAHLERGWVVYAGVDYKMILAKAEAEAEVIVWDGGNNDFPFFESSLEIVVADPHRAGHERLYHPGEVNLLRAHCVVINKVDSAQPGEVAKLESTLRALNPKADIVKADSVISADKPEWISGKTVLIVEDGPTLTHGEMSYGAGLLAAKRWGAQNVLDPRPYARGSIRKVFQAYPHLCQVLPAMGYGDIQLKELQETIEASPADSVLVGTPVDLSKVIRISKPCVRIAYELQEHSDLLKRRVERLFQTTA